MSLNCVNVMGNLTRDPEIRYTPAGKAVCNLSIANNRIYNKNGERQTEVSYFDVEVWGVIAENCSKYLSKGSGIIVEGRLRQDRWEKDGKTQSRVRIVAANIHFLAKKRDDTGGNQSSGGGQEYSAGQVYGGGSNFGNSSSPDITPDSIAWDE